MPWRRRRACYDRGIHPDALPSPTSAAPGARFAAALHQWQRRARRRRALRSALLASALTSAGLIAANLLRGAPSSLVANAALWGVTSLVGAVAGMRRPRPLVLARTLDELAGRGDDAILAAASLVVERERGTLSSFEGLACARASRVLDELGRTRAKVGPRVGRPAAIGAALALAALLTTPGVVGSRGALKPEHQARTMGLERARGAQTHDLQETRGKMEALIAEAARREDAEAGALGAAWLAALPHDANEVVSPRRAARLAELASALAEAWRQSADLEARMSAARRSLTDPLLAGADARAASSKEQEASLAERLAALARTTSAGRRSATSATVTPPTAEPKLADALGEAATALGQAGGSASRGGETGNATLGTGRPEELGTSPSRPGAAAQATTERQLERLRRDLDQAAETCRRDPARCGAALDRAAEEARALAREKGEPELRRRLADAAAGWKPPSPAQRTAEAGPSSPSVKASTRAPSPARGAESGRQGTSASQGEGTRAEGAAGDDGTTASQDDATSRAAEGPSSSPERHASATPSSAGAAKPSREGQAAGAVGRGLGSSVVTTEEAVVVGSSGQGQTPGAPLSPTADEDGARPSRGRIAGPAETIDVEDTGVGLSRATTIQGAAERGLASPGYRRVFADYAAVADEAVEDTHVSPLHRRLVERYFEVIRPR